MGSRIVVAVDFSEITKTVLDAAAEEAKLRPGAQLHALHVVHAPSLVSGGVAIDMSGELARAHEELERCVAASGLEVICHVRLGNASDEINALALEVEANLVVVGASTKGLAMLVLVGSTTHALLGKCGCSVLIVRPDAPAIEAARDDQDDDVHKRHHPLAHTYTAAESPDADFGDGSNRVRA